MASRMQVAEAQRFANKAGVPLRENGVNGVFTRRFVATFQQAYTFAELAVDGDPGPLTIGAMGACEEAGFRLSEHFVIGEFLTKGERRVTWQNEVLKVDRQLVLSLEQLRVSLGFPVHLLSAYRDPAHNRRVGGAARSQHLFGKAVDLNRPRMVRNITEAEVRAAGFKGVGMMSRTNPDVVHVDVRATPARWYYR